MPSLTTLAVIGVGGLALYAVVRAGFAALKQAGRDAERADRAQAEVRSERRRSAVIAEQRTVEDAQKRLDSGSF